ncbi:MAG: threonine synthase [Hyphomonadaceae bacterium]
MQYVSTRGDAPAVLFSEALLRGIAPDGGLYVPNQWPRFDARGAPGPLSGFAAKLIAPFLAGDALEAALPAITADALNFPAPLAPIEKSAARVLELFHGPTAAFKDFGARFLAASQARAKRRDARDLHILVATSGDTGGAVAAAFHNRPGVRVSVLFPKGMVSPAQERQLTCWGGNVAAFSVRGAFDDCQRLVKEAFKDAALGERFALSSANSINIARLLPQMTYFAAASLDIWNATGERASFVVPSGNLGHATACVWARHIGLPIDQIVLAHNANRTMPDYLTSGEWRARPTIPTLASAMDVGDPSNGERLRSLYPNLDDLRRVVTAYVVEDEAIRTRIASGFRDRGQIWCPHTAAAAEAYERHTANCANPGQWVIVSTAHAAKFPEIVEPIIGRSVPIPAALAALPPAMPATELDPDLAALRAALL